MVGGRHGDPKTALGYVRQAVELSDDLASDHARLAVLRADLEEPVEGSTTS